VKGAKIMDYVNWFVGTMKKLFDINVTEDDVSYEAYAFCQEEIDDLLIPAEHLAKLPDPLLLETLSYVDENRNEWIAGAVLDENTGDILYEVWIKNGEAIVQKMHDEKMSGLKQ
jgi:hypothetical protein